MKFGCYASLKGNLGDECQGSLWKATFGAIAATVAHVVTYPNDTLRRRLQLQGVPGSPILYKGYFDCFRKVVRLEGWPALYAGLGITILRGVPNTGIQFGMYELCKDVRRRRDSNSCRSAVAQCAAWLPPWLPPLAD